MTDTAFGSSNQRREGGQGGTAPVGSPLLQASVKAPNPQLRVLHGHVLEMLQQIPDGSVDCCVTSPPYWGLRDYGLPPQVWDGADGCSHSWAADGSCHACPGWRGQLGLEPTLDLYLRHMVDVFRQIRRVLKPSGVLWLNLGDTYNSATTAPRRPSAGSVAYWRAGGSMGDRRVRVPGLKVKDLVGLPWRVALALQADDWYLRSDVIWAKPNPLPEGVTDRPVRAHEYLFLLTKNHRYFFDAEAVREPSAPVGPGRPMGEAPAIPLCSRKLRSVWSMPTQPYSGAHFATFPERLVERCIRAGSSEAGICSHCGEPWRRRTRVSYVNPGHRTTNGPRSIGRRAESPGYPTRLERRVLQDGFVAACGCGAPARPAVVLDPFAGSGTTLAVARRQGRDSLGIELSRAYFDLIGARLRSIGTSS